MVGRIRTFRWTPAEVRAWEEAHVSAGRIVLFVDERAAARARLIGVRAIARKDLDEGEDDERVF